MALFSGPLPTWYSASIRHFCQTHYFWAPVLVALRIQVWKCFSRYLLPACTTSHSYPGFSQQYTWTLGPVLPPETDISPSAPLSLHSSWGELQFYCCHCHLSFSVDTPFRRDAALSASAPELSACLVDVSWALSPASKTRHSGNNTRFLVPHPVHPVSDKGTSIFPGMQKVICIWCWFYVKSFYEGNVLTLFWSWTRVRIQ